jgi:two-component system response regulator HydG
LGKKALGNTIKSVLIIDDDNSVLRTFSRLLQKSGYEVETAETGKEAIEKVCTRSFDVLLVDFRLPDINGVELLEKTKTNGNVQNAVKIMITGFPSLEVGAKALDLGIDAYIVKPVNPFDLLSLISEKLRNKKP